MVRPSTDIIFRMPLGVARSGPPRLLTEDTKRECSSGVQRSLGLMACEGCAGAATRHQDSVRHSAAWLTASETSRA